jgi:hypothetical protein
VRGNRARPFVLAAALFDVLDVIAGHRWTDSEIPSLLLQLNAAIADEVEALAAMPPTPSAHLDAVNSAAR